MSSDGVRESILASPFGRSLGAVFEEAAPECVRLRIPFRDEISNPGRALHGGVMAAAIDLAATAVSRRDQLSPLAVESGCVDLSVDYLAAAIGEDIVATAEVLRRGKELTYCRVDVRNDVGKGIAAGRATHRFVERAAVSQAAERQLDDAVALPAAESYSRIRGAEMFVKLGFIAHLGMQVLHAHGGEAILSMPSGADHLDERGAIHEGALAALTDTTGALASWSIVGLDLRHKASTVGLHLNFLRPAEGDVVAHARTRRRNNEIFVNQVELGDRGGERLVALGTVTYRIVIRD